MLKHRTMPGTLWVGYVGTPVLARVGGLCVPSPLLQEPGDVELCHAYDSRKPQRMQRKVMIGIWFSAETVDLHHDLFTGGPAAHLVTNGLALP